jgi:hypothetical protein
MLGLPDEAWPDKETREHCRGVFDYARVVLEASDGDLLSDQASRGYVMRCQPSRATPRQRRTTPTPTAPT